MTVLDERSAANSIPTPAGEARAPIMLAPGDGRTLHPMGLNMSVKAGGAQTGGALTVIEWTAAPGTNSPPAIHDGDDEAFYVLEGEFTIQVGERKLRATAGSFVYVPRGTLHTVACEGTSAGRTLMIFTPGRMDRFFDAAAALPPGPPNPETMKALGQQFQSRFFPPAHPA